MDLPEVGIDLSLIEEFLDVPWGVFHEWYLLIQRSFISIPTGTLTARVPGLFLKKTAVADIRTVNR